jgi:hypothetical protein
MKTRQKVLLGMALALFLLGPFAGNLAQRHHYGPVHPQEDVFVRDGRAMISAVTSLYFEIPGTILGLAGVLDLVVDRVRKSRQNRLG